MDNDTMRLQIAAELKSAAASVRTRNWVPRAPQEGECCLILSRDGQEAPIDTTGPAYGWMWARTGKMGLARFNDSFGSKEELAAALERLARRIELELEGR